MDYTRPHSIFTNVEDYLFLFSTIKNECPQSVCNTELYVFGGTSVHKTKYVNNVYSGDASYHMVPYCKPVQLYTSVKTTVNVREWSDSSRVDCVLHRRIYHMIPYCRLA